MAPSLLVSIEELSIGFRGPPLLDGVDCKIFSGERIGLLGRNGVGKTTFMELLRGCQTPDHGRIEMHDSLRLAQLPQDVPGDLQGPVGDVIAQGFPKEWLAADMQWKADQQLERVAVPMELDLESSFHTLSTGMKRRVLLARAIVQQPDLLLLDEPTNHLDISSIEWLEDFLLSLPCSLIFVTHDRRFLTKLATRILEIDRGNLYDWSCDYPTFLKRKEAAQEAIEKQEALFDKKLSQEEAWIRQGIKARRTRNEGRVRALKELRMQRQARQSKVGLVNMQIDTGAQSGVLVLEAKEAAFGYAQTPIVSGVSCRVQRGDKLGIIGPNGAGKSTLLKGLLGELPALDGSIRKGTNLSIAYFDQNRNQLDPEQTAEENVGAGKTSVEINGRSKHVIGYLQEFLFSPDQARTPVKFFSGGQRSRLLLAKLFSQPANVLVLDEPTNDLDSETLELLESRLVDYEGTVLLISHDREFLNNVVGGILAIESGNVREYVGGYDDWKRVASQSRSEKPVQRSAKPSAAARETVGNANEALKKLSFKESKELAELPAKIEQLEEQQSQMHSTMASESFYKQPSEEIATFHQSLAELASHIKQAYSRWEELESRA